MQRLKYTYKSFHLASRLVGFFAILWELQAPNGLAQFLLSLLYLINNFIRSKNSSPLFKCMSVSLSV